METKKHANLYTCNSARHYMSCPKPQRLQSPLISITKKATIQTHTHYALFHIPLLLCLPPPPPPTLQQPQQSSLLHGKEYA
ncbi:hypothetical protein VNO78_27088 [Psophocarpus tetragonolobus]|uniref:Uncharacterized protein n=1 Tax=Psophocarpus tetragonolobus TaxID=3891 RepID=A0AAN9S0Q7_PSOTE